VDVIKVSGTSRTSAVAGAIAGVVRENKRAEVQAIGASAVNQAVKAMTLAKGYLVNDGSISILYLSSWTWTSKARFVRLLSSLWRYVELP
jgi:stage V sporulation protein SpoVS